MNHQDLYKVKSKLSNQNRLKDYKIRCQVKRIDTYQSGRFLTISPDFKVNDIAENNKEIGTNIKLLKIQKQDAYFAKYLSWKQDKEKRKIESKLNYKKPFCSTCSTKSSNHGSASTGVVTVPETAEKETIFQNYIVAPIPPKKQIPTNNNIQKNNMMRPPPTPPKKQILNNNIQKNNMMRPPPTPPKKQILNNNIQKNSMMRPPPTLPQKQILNNNVQKNNLMRSPATSPKKQILNNIQKNNMMRPPPTLPKKQISNNNIQKSSMMRPPPPKKTPPFTMKKQATTTDNIRKIPVKKPSVNPIVLNKIKPNSVKPNPEIISQNKKQQPITKVNTMKSQLLKSEPISKNKKENKFKYLVEMKSSKIIENTPNENPEHPFKSVFTSTQRKESLNTNLQIPDDLRESIISPIDFIDNKSDDKLLINLNITQDNWCPSPIKQTSPLNYLSPFVTTSRGKGNAKKEKEKRDSIYLLEKTSPEEESMTIRHMKEAVRRFNKLLNDETERLKNLCNIWNKYINDNSDLLNDNGCIDMINATLGQTNLLLTKKFQKFADLIEKCSNYYMKNINDGKPIYPEDLEGFWGMVNIQIDDIDKRFNNINKWKENNWIDPDVIPKPKKLHPLLSIVSKKSKKKTVQPSHKLKAYLKKIIKDHRKKEINNTQEEYDNIITIRKRRSSNISSSNNNTNKENTSLRRSNRRISNLSTSNKTMENKDNLDTPIRKNFRYSKPATPGLMVLLPKNDNIETPRRNIRSEWRCVNLLKSVSNETETIETQLLQPVRKSILKTPGTLKKSRNVIFNDNLEYKSPEQKLKIPNSSEGKRSLRLRSRKLLIDPDAKIEIPHANKIIHF